MTLVKLNRKPFERSYQNWVDGIFNDFPALVRNEFSGLEGKNFNPPVNIKETENSYQVDVIAPGFDKADFKVSIDKDLLTVSAEKQTNTKEEGNKTETDKGIRNEYTYRSFKRSFTIDEKIDATNIGATYVNGVLALNLPKIEPVKQAPTEIKIN